jgi:hypothetical protein
MSMHFFSKESWTKLSQLFLTITLLHDSKNWCYWRQLDAETTSSTFNVSQDSAGRGNTHEIQCQIWKVGELSDHIFLR